MPNRILKNSICESETLDKLSAEQEVFFYRLLVNCDDFGLMDARRAILISKCYPLRISNLSEDTINNWLLALQAAGLIELYDVGDHPYLKITKWEYHQTIRAKKSKYPHPSGNGHGNLDTCKQMQADEIICKQTQANVPVIQSNSYSLYIKSNPITFDTDSQQAKKVIDLYQNNISVNLTPIIHDELMKIAANYEMAWIEYAIMEAAKRNARNLKYVIAILNSCAEKGNIPQDSKPEPRKVVYKELD